MRSILLIVWAACFLIFPGSPSDAAGNDSPQALKGVFDLSEQPLPG